MAEYPPKSCTACPKLVKFEEAKEVGDHLQKNTVPKPELAYQERTNLTDSNLGVPKANLVPDLSTSPLEKEGEKKKVCNKKPAQVEIKTGPQYDDRGEPCSCQMPTAPPELVEPCPVSPYSVEDCGDKKPIKGILKNSGNSSMAAQQGSYDPHAEPPTAVRPEPAARAPCYLPQPQDAFPDEKGEQEMGPIGPWATGRVDWSPMAGMTGTRPIVDKYSITRFSEGEWRRGNKAILDATSEAEYKANMVDWNGRRCLEQTRADVDKNQEDSTKRLSQREQDMRRWKCELESAIGAASEEVNTLEEQRRRLKTAAAVLQMPESIAGECLDRRTSRMDSELTRDEVEEELIKEVALTAEIRETFARTLKDVELQMIENKTAKARLEFDWSDKQYAHELESINVALNNKSTILMFRPGATRLPDEQSSAEHWEHFTRETLQEGEATRQRSVVLRGTLEAILVNAARDLRSQADKVDLALSRRVACTEQMRIQLENDLRKILQRLADVENIIRDIRDAIRRMDIPMKKAQTRLDNRLLRPRVENCRDEAHFGLIEEVKSIGENVSALMGQLKQAEQSQENLIKIRGDLEREIMVKRKTLEIDRTRAQDIRSYYPSATALSGH